MQYGPVRVTVITSCLPFGLEQTLQHLKRNGIRFIDLYCFSELDLPALEEAGAVQRLADGLIVYGPSDRMAQWVVSQLRSVGDFHIGGLASNLPYLSRVDSATGGQPDHRRTAAIVSLANLIAVADSLVVPTVEIVCGRRIIADEGSMPYTARFVRPDQAIDALVSGVADAWALARGDESTVARYQAWGSALPGGLGRDPNVGVAIEVEPGEEFLCRDLDAAARILAAFEERGMAFCGLNLDIGHQFILESQPDMLTDIHGERRVVHCHVSDHLSSHFCDFVPGTHHALEDFRRWLELYVNTVRRAPDRHTYYSGTVAVELEGCQSVDEVDRGYDLVCQLVDELVPRDLRNEPRTCTPPRLAWPETDDRRSWYMDGSVAVAFVDLRKSSAYLEAAGYGPAATLTNRFYKMVCDCIQEFGGTVDKFIGDSVMWLQGHDRRPYEWERYERAREMSAVGSALFAGAKIIALYETQMNQLWDDFAKKARRQFPTVKPGIGLHVTRCAVGQFGSPDHHEFSIIGPAANYAHHLSSVAEADEILLTSAIYEELLASEPELITSIRSMLGALGCDLVIRQRDVDPVKGTAVELHADREPLSAASLTIRVLGAQQGQAAASDTSTAATNHAVGPRSSPADAVCQRLHLDDKQTAACSRRVADNDLRGAIDLLGQAGLAREEVAILHRDLTSIEEDQRRGVQTWEQVKVAKTVLAQRILALLSEEGS